MRIPLATIRIKGSEAAQALIPLKMANQQATVFNANQGNLNFSNAIPIIGNGTATGNIVRYSNVISVGDQSIDAVITTKLNNASITSYDSEKTPTTRKDFFQPSVSIGSGGGSVTYTIDFYIGGTYTGAGTGTPATLQNVVVNSYDIDGSSPRKQFQDFKGFARYELPATSKRLEVITNADGSVRFLSPGGSGNGTEDAYRVRVFYDSIRSFELTTGAQAGGSALYALDFGLGPNWTQPTQTTGTPAANISYSTTNFVEDSTDRGAFSQTTEITLENGLFTGRNGEPIEGVTISNVPEGLTATIIRTSDTTALLSFSGNASSHRDADDINNLTVQFSDASFANSNASVITGIERSDISLSFFETSLPPISISSIEVNEGSPYALFVATGTSGQTASLALVNDQDPDTADATLGTDTGTQLQVFDGSTWLDYEPGSTVSFPDNGTLLIRVAIKNDDPYEGPEIFQLTATTSDGATAHGTAIINDNGTGDIYPDNNTGDPDSDTAKDDDRIDAPSPSTDMQVMATNDAENPPDPSDPSPESNSEPESDSISEPATALNNPEIEILGESGNSNLITIQDTEGNDLIADEQYTIAEVILQDQPGKSAYLIKLVDADPNKDGEQAFGSHYQGANSGNSSGSKDGTYSILFDGLKLTSFNIKTQKLSKAERLACLDAIYGEEGNHSLSSKLYGHRVDQKRGTDGDDNLRGDSKENNTLKGRDGSDVLNAVGDRLTGASFDPADFATDQVDILIGGKGPDTFQLADIAGSFYGARGTADRAVIKDFSAGDRLLLYGQASDYALSPISGGQMELSRNGDLIAILRGKGIAGLDLTDSSQVAYF